jgi:hypothetical protein
VAEDEVRRPPARRVLDELRPIRVFISAWICSVFLNMPARRKDISRPDPAPVHIHRAATPPEDVRSKGLLGKRLPGHADNFYSRFKGGAISIKRKVLIASIASV